MIDFLISYVLRLVASAADKGVLDEGIDGHSYMGRGFLLGVLSALTLVGCKVAGEKTVSSANLSQATFIGAHMITKEKKSFLLPGSPRGTMGMMIDSLLSGSFSQLHDQFFTPLNVAPELLQNDRDIFTFVSYESGACADNPRPMGVTLGIFQCPQGKGYRGYGATQGVMDSTNRRVEIPVQDVDLFEYRIRDLLPVLERNAFTINKNVADLKPPAVTHFPDPYVTILAEKPNQIVAITYDAGAPGAPPDALILALTIYVIEE